MTIVITKTKLALAILAIALLAPAAALADNIFADVDDGAFYAEPVKWAFDNNITTGKTPTSFAPLDNVTRGESVTFLKRYDTNIVQPALAALEAQIAGLTSSSAVFEGGNFNQPITTTADAIAKSVTITAPADGVIVITATADVEGTSNATTARCSLSKTSNIELAYMDQTTVDNGDWRSMALTRGYEVTAGTTTTVNLVCDAFPGGYNLHDASMIAVFAPS
jgi:S-layer homology domain